MQNDAPVDHPDPYTAPFADNDGLTTYDLLEEPEAELQVVNVARKQEAWTVCLHSDRLRFLRTGVAVHDVMRDDLFETAVLRDSGMLPRTLTLKIGKKQKGLQFSPDDFKTLNSWIQPLTDNDLKMQLKRRFAFVLPIAVLFIVLALPMAGDPAAGVAALPFDAVSLTLGISLAAVVIASKIVPHRIFFLLDSLWFAALAGSIVFDVMTGESTWHWLFIVVIQVQVTVAGVRLYRQFANVQPYQPRLERAAF